MARRFAALFALFGVMAPIVLVCTGQAAGADPCPGPSPAASIAATTGMGFYVASTDGCIGTAGDAVAAGQPGALAAPIVGVAAAPHANGYWEVASYGGIFTYGAARFAGSLGWLHLNQPIVGMAATPDGAGYWLVARDGGVFAFGKARFFGSTGAIRLNQPIVGMAATADGGGYWFVARDGGVFTFGDAPFLGSAAAVAGAPQPPVIGIAATPTGKGYWIGYQANDQIDAFGDAATMQF